MVKIVVNVACILIAAFVFNDVYFLVGAYIVAAVISMFINAFPNKRVVGYSFGAQIRDIGPSFLLTLAACGAAQLVGLLSLTGFSLLVVQILVFFVVYFGLSLLFRLEEFSYLVSEIGRKIPSCFSH